MKQVKLPILLLFLTLMAVPAQGQGFLKRLKDKAKEVVREQVDQTKSDVKSEVQGKVDGVLGDKAGSTVSDAVSSSAVSSSSKGESSSGRPIDDFDAKLYSIAQSVNCDQNSSLTKALYPALAFNLQHALHFAAMSNANDPSSLLPTYWNSASQIMSWIKSRNPSGQQWEDWKAEYERVYKIVRKAAPGDGRPDETGDKKTDAKNMILFLVQRAKGETDDLNKQRAYYNEAANRRINIVAQRLMTEDDPDFVKITNDLTELQNGFIARHDVTDLVRIESYKTITEKFEAERYAVVFGVKKYLESDGPALKKAAIDELHSMMPDAEVLYFGFRLQSWARTPIVNWLGFTIGYRKAMTGVVYFRFKGHIMKSMFRFLQTCGTDGQYQRVTWPQFDESVAIPDDVYKKYYDKEFGNK